MTDERLRSEIMTALNLGSLSKGIGEGFPYLERFEGICKEYAAAKDARIEELELVIEYAAACLDLVHPDDYDAWEKINRIYQNLENKTRWEI